MKMFLLMQVHSQVTTPLLDMASNDDRSVILTTSFHELKLSPSLSINSLDSESPVAFPISSSIAFNGREPRIPQDQKRMESNTQRES